MTSWKANVMLVNFTLRNFAAGKPSVNDSEFAAASSSPITQFMVVREIPIHNVVLFKVLQRFAVSNQHVTSAPNNNSPSCCLLAL